MRRCAFSELVSHSMGGAFSMGIEDYIKEQGRAVDYNVINLGQGELKNADMKIRENSPDDLYYIHN